MTTQMLISRAGMRDAPAERGGRNLPMFAGGASSGTARRESTPVGELKNLMEAVVERKNTDKYGEYHLSFCAHYVGDLSQPLHNTLYNSYNRKYHQTSDGIINDEVLDNIDKIKIYPIKIESENALAKEIARIANLSLKKGYQIQNEKRLLTKEEAYEQISHSASLFRAILKYVEKID
jgi:hypothetical protein